MKYLAKSGLTVGVSVQDMAFACALLDRVYLLKEDKIEGNLDIQDSQSANELIVNSVDKKLS